MIRWHWRPWSILAGAALLCLGGTAAAQPESPFKGGELKAPTPTEKEVNQWSTLVRLGDIAANNQGNVAGAKAALKAELAANKAVMEKVLTWYICRITHLELQEGTVPEEEMKNNRVAGNLGDHMAELFGETSNNRRRVLPRSPSPVPSPWLSVETRTSTPDPVMVELQFMLMDEIRPLSMQHLKQVLQNQNLIARLNAVRVLCHFASFGQDAIAPELLAVLENKDEHDAVKYHAVLGLGKLFELTKEKKLFKDDKGIAMYRKCATAVLNWLEKDTKHDPEKLKLLTEEERLAISFRRRAAIQALGETHRALVIDGAELGQAANRAGPIAEVLLRIVANDNAVQPAPNWTERVIAAKAVCKLDPNLSPSYQPDYAIYIVAKFANEMATGGRDADRDALTVYASELKISLDQLLPLLPKAQDSPGTTYVQTVLMPELNPVLEHLYDRNKERSAPQKLLGTLETKKPPSKDVYKPLAR
jgi:hypothetical protein